MIELYHSGGAGDFELDGPTLPSDHSQRLRSNTARLLLKRDNERAAELLTAIPFEVTEASNHFADQFSVLHATVPLEQYHDIGAIKASGSDTQAFRPKRIVCSPHEEWPMPRATRSLAEK